MKQKLAMARAMIHRPPLVFLDEPTAGLDVIAATALREDLAAMAAREGVTIFLTTHNMAEAEKLKQTGSAEAESMLKKAQAWERYNDAALFESYMKILPELAKSVSEPLSKVDKIVMVSGDKGLGTTKLTSQVAEVLAQMPEVVKSLTGVDLKQYLKEKLTPEKKKEED